MLYFLDTEFIENGKTIDLVSIAIVCADGRELYAESSEANLDLASSWVKENVLSNLWHRKSDKSEYNRWSRDGGIGGLLKRKEIVSAVETFVKPNEQPSFWGYYADYDWVAFCQLFGTMMDLPKGMPMFCNDIKQLSESRGNPELPKQSTEEHNALADARWNKKAYYFLQTK